VTQGSSGAVPVRSVSARMSATSPLPPASASGADRFDDEVPDTLARQNRELRRRLEDEQASYRRRLDTYRQVRWEAVELPHRWF